MKSPSLTRRDFVRMSAGAMAAGAAVKATLLEPPMLAPRPREWTQDTVCLNRHRDSRLRFAAFGAEGGDGRVRGHC